MHNKNMILAALVVIAIFLMIGTGVSYYRMTPPDKGTIIVYGSKTCPWCVKQEDYLKNKGIPYEFVDCKNNKCPDFVDGFPTLSINGQIKSGYTEI